MVTFITIYGFHCQIASSIAKPNISISTQLNGSSHNKWINSSVWPIDVTPTFPTTLVWVDLEVMAIKRHSTLHKNPGLKPNLLVESRTLVEESFITAEMMSAYFIAPIDRVNMRLFLSVYGCLFMHVCIYIYIFPEIRRENGYVYLVYWWKIFNPVRDMTNAEFYMLYAT